MKLSIQTIIKIVLIALIVITIVFLLLPASYKFPPDIIHSAATDKPGDDEETETTVETLNSAVDIAVLFGGKRPTPTPRPYISPVPTRTPVPTPFCPGWLKLISAGIVIEGKQYYIFKDERYNTTVQIAEGVSDKGWSLVRETSDKYYLKKDGGVYCVQK